MDLQGGADVTRLHEKTENDEPDADAGQIVKLRFEVIHEIKPGQTIMDAMDAAKAIREFVKQHGSVTGVVQLGRSKFPI